MSRVATLFVFSILFWQASWAQSTGDFRSAVTTGNWNVNNSWQTYNGTSWVAAVASPQVADGVITIQTGHTITLTTSEIVDQVVVDGTVKINASTQLDFPTSVTGDAMRVNGTLDNSGTIVMQTTPIVRMTNASGGIGTYIARQGSVISNATATNLLFDAGSTYQHSFSTTAGTIPSANWNVASTCLLKGTNTTAPGNLNQTFGNVTLDVIGGSTGLGGVLTTVKGNFSTAPTNTRTWTLSAGISYTLNIDGDFVSAGGNLLITTAAGNVVNINVSKDLKYTGGSISKSGAGTATVIFKGTTQQNLLNTTPITFGAINFSVLSGAILDLGVSSLTGTGTFTLNSGATLQLGSLNSTGALVTGTTLGNVRVSGTRTYNSGSTITYNGAGAQFLGNNHPSGTGITTIINNAAGVTLATTPFTLNGNLTLQSGDFTTNGRSLTLGGIFTPNANSLVADVGTSLTITDTGSTADFGLLKITGTSVIGNLTIAGSVGRTVRLGSDLATSSFTQNIGDFQLNGFTLNLQGSISQVGGTLTSTSTSGLNISDEVGGSLPVNLAVAGGSINTITMNRLGETLTTSSALDVTNIDLVAGTLTATGTFRINTNGKISVASGLLTNPVTAISTYNVEYYGTNDVFTGAELPVSATILNDLTNLKPATVYLSAAATVNGSLILSDGNFNSNGQALTLNGNFISNGASNFYSGTVTYNGTTTISGTVTPQFGNLIVNNTKSLAINGNLQINVGGNFTMNGSFTPNQSTVLLDSAVNQTISGSNLITFYKLEIEKSANQVTIQNAVDLQDALNIKTATTLNVGTNLLRLVSNASRTARVNPLLDLASISGSVIAERYMPYGSAVREYRYVTPVVTNTFVSDWQAEIPITGTFSNPSTGTGINSTAPSLYYYNETLGGTLTGRYVAYPTSGNSSAAALTNGLGYALFVRSTTPVVLDSRGTLSQHQKILSVTAQSASGNDGWNLIGNPYPSPVLWDKVGISSGVNNAIYTRDNTGISSGGAGSYVTYISGVSVPAGYNGMIDSGQAFWVHATSNGTVTFNETDKIIATDSVAQFYREESESELLRLFITGTSGGDELAIRFSNDATDDFDTKYDALKLPNDDINLSSLSAESKEMTINTLGPLNCSRKITLSLNNIKEGDHTLKASGIESFGSDVEFVLYDYLTNATIDFRSIPEYTFSVTSQNIGSIATRFALEIGKSRILKDLAVSSESVCFGNSISFVSIENTQSEVSYQLFLKGKSISDWITGNNGQVKFSVPVKNINVNNNYFTVLAKNSCTSDSLKNKPLIAKSRELKITNTIDGKICQTGNTTLQASGANVGELYNWYKTIDDINPVAIESEGKLVVSDLKEDSNYYVALKNSNGCEGERIKVSVSVVNFESVFITEVGDVLVSSYEAGNNWYFNGNLIEGETTNKLTIKESGEYSVKVIINGCVTEDKIIETITGLEESLQVDFTLYPNPATDNVTLSFGSKVTGLAQVVITSSSGLQIYSEKLEVSDNSQHTLPLASNAPGVYIIRVAMGDKTITKRIVKL